MFWRSLLLVAAQVCAKTDTEAEKRCANGTDDSLKVVGFCTFFPCNGGHGEVECKDASDSNLTFTGGRSLFTWAVKVCVCSQDTCSYDQYYCKKYTEWVEPRNEAWNTGLSQQEGVIDAFGVAFYQVLQLSSFFGVFVVVSVGLVYLCKRSRNDSRFFSVYMLLKPSNGKTASRVVSIVAQLLLLVVWLCLIWASDSDIAAEGRACLAANSKYVRLHRLIFGLILIVLSEISYPLCGERRCPWPGSWWQCPWRGWKDIRVAGTASDITLRGLDTHLESVFEQESSNTVMDSSNKVKEYLKLVQLLLRISGVNVCMIYGMERHFGISAVMLLLWLSVREVYVVRTVVTHPSFKADFRKKIEVAYEYDKELRGFKKVEEQCLSSAQMNDNVYVGITPTDIYMDVSKPFGKKMMVVFVGQVFLFFVYISSLRDEIFPVLCQDKINWMLMCPTCAIQLLMITQMGKSYANSLVEWSFLLHSKRSDDNCSDVELRMPYHHDPKWASEIFQTKGDSVGPFMVHTPHVQIRFVLAAIVNGLFYNFLIQSIFLTLVGNIDGMDYVKDCLAVGFITVLDDMNYDEPAAFIKKMTIKESCYKTAGSERRERVKFGDPDVQIALIDGPRKRQFSFNDYLGDNVA